MYLCVSGGVDGVGGEERHARPPQCLPDITAPWYELEPGQGSSGCLICHGIIIIGMLVPASSRPSSFLSPLFTPSPYLDLDFQRLHGGLSRHLQVEVA